jgi:hypothetical protein
MAKSSKKIQRTKTAIPQMPFDDALRKILKAPPQHRKAKMKKNK